MKNYRKLTISEKCHGQCRAAEMTYL